MLESLQIHGFRAFRELEIGALGRVNLLVGKNNVGKTTVLEAVRLYAAGVDALDIARDILVERQEYTREQEKGIRSYRLFHQWDGEAPRRLAIRSSGGHRALELRVGWTRLDEETGGRHLVSESQVGRGSDEAYDETVILECDGERRFQPIPGPHRRGPRANREGQPCRLISARGLGENGAARLWDVIALTEHEETVIDALRLMAPELQAVTFIVPPGRKERVAIAKCEGRPAEPLKSMGDGMNRLFELALGLASAQGGYLLIDEPENGIHYGVLPDVWRLVFQTAARLDVQVFAATHSWDCIEAFQEAASAHEAEGVLIRLERDDSDIRAVTFSEEELAIATREDIEVR